MLTNLRLEVNQGHQTVPFHILGIVSSCAIVTSSLRCAVLPTFNFKNAVTLKTGLGGPSRSLEISPFDRVHMTSY